jgi:hypothetical protein
MDSYINARWLLVTGALMTLCGVPLASAQVECLVGTWDVDPSTVTGDLAAVDQTPEITWSVLGGQYRVTLTADGQFTNVKEDFQVLGEYRAADEVPLGVIMESNARTSGRYAVRTPGEIEFVVEASTGTATAQQIVTHGIAVARRGQPIGDPQTVSIADPITGEPMVNAYTCEGDRLRILGLGRPGGVGADWVEFTRVAP